MPPTRTFRTGETLQGGRYATGPGHERGSVRSVLLTGLGEFLGFPVKTMHWAGKGFRDEIFVRYGVKLVGWPPDVPFMNLSDLKDRPTEKIQQLLACWEDRTMKWAWATPEEIVAARESVYNAIPGKHFPNPDPPRGQRSDFGKHRERPVTNPGGMWGKRYIRDGPKSYREVSDEWLLEDAGGSVGAAAEDEPEGIQDTAAWDLEAWRKRRLPSGELADDLIQSF